MKLNKSSGVTLVEFMIVIAILGLLAAIAIPNFYAARQNDLKIKQEYLQIGPDNRELIKFSGSETGIVNRVLELPNTPMHQSFPIIEIMVTNDSGRAYLRSAFPKNPEKLTQGDKVLVTTIEHVDHAGGRRVHFVTKLDQ